MRRTGSFCRLMLCLSLALGLGSLGCGDDEKAALLEGALCTDLDGDGFFSQDGCGTELDCDDLDPDLNPGNFEGPVGDPSCEDAQDNDCDIDVDGEDPGCVQCNDLDGDGYGFPASEFCEHPGRDCNDGDPNINPGVTETPDNGIDDDCNPVTPTWGTPLSTVQPGGGRPSAVANVLLLLFLPLGLVWIWRSRAGR